MKHVVSYTRRRKNRRVSLGLVERPGRRKIIEGKDRYCLELTAAESDDGTFASARKNYIKTMRYISPVSMHSIVGMFFDLTYGFRISAISSVVTKDGDAILLNGEHHEGG